MKLQDVKKANKEFFAEAFTDFYGDIDIEILPEIDGPVLRMTSKLGTRPVYKIDKGTLVLSYLRHDTEF